MKFLKGSFPLPWEVLLTLAVAHFKMIYFSLPVLHNTCPYRRVKYMNI